MNECNSGTLFQYECPVKLKTGDKMEVKYLVDVETTFIDGKKIVDTFSYSNDSLALAEARIKNANNCQIVHSKIIKKYTSEDKKAKIPSTEKMFVICQIHDGHSTSRCFSSEFNKYDVDSYIKETRKKYPEMKATISATRNGQTIKLKDEMEEKKNWKYKVRFNLNGDLPLMGEPFTRFRYFNTKESAIDFMNILSEYDPRSVKILTTDRAEKEMADLIGKVNYDVTSLYGMPDYGIPDTITTCDNAKATTDVKEKETAKDDTKKYPSYLGIPYPVEHINLHPTMKKEDILKAWGVNEYKVKSMLNLSKENIPVAQPVNKEKPGFIVVHQYVGHASNEKVQAFCEKVRDEFTKAKEWLEFKAKFPNWNFLLLPSRTEESRIEVFHEEEGKRDEIMSELVDRIPYEQEQIEDSHNLRVRVKDYIKLYLGAPIINIELTESQLDFCYENSLKMMQDAALLRKCHTMTDSYFAKDENFLMEGALAHGMMILGRIRMQNGVYYDPNRYLTPKDLYKEGEKQLASWKKAMLIPCAIECGEENEELLIDEVIDLVRSFTKNVEISGVDNNVEEEIDEFMMGVEECFYEFIDRKKA